MSEEFDEIVASLGDLDLEEHFRGLITGAWNRGYLDGVRACQQATVRGMEISREVLPDDPALNLVLASLLALYDGFADAIKRIEETH